MQKDAEDLRAELDAVRAEMARAAQQAEAARQDDAKNVCQIRMEGEAQVCLSLAMYHPTTYLLRTVQGTQQSAWCA